MDGGTYWHVYIPALPGIGINNWNIGQRSNGLFLPIAPEAGWYPSMMTNGTLTIDGSKIAVMPNREFTIAAKDAYSKPEYTTATLWLTHRVTDNLDLALTGYYYSDSRDSQNYEGVGFLALDINKQLPNGQANPNFGKRYGDFMISAQTQEREVKELRAQLNYKFERQLFGQPYRQTFSVCWTAGHHLARPSVQRPDPQRRHHRRRQSHHPSPHLRGQYASLDCVAIDHWHRLRGLRLA